MGPSGGGVRRGSGEAHLVSDFRFVFLGVGVGMVRGLEKAQPGAITGQTACK